jgi:hypothetical protein
MLTGGYFLHGQDVIARIQFGIFLFNGPEGLEFFCCCFFLSCHIIVEQFHSIHQTLEVLNMLGGLTYLLCGVKAKH